MFMPDIIGKKRDGFALSDDEIRFFVSGTVDGSIPDYQQAALLMAVYFRGMTEKETAVLTDAMARSGDMLDLSRFGELSADKHSTGGVGDKTSLIVAPTAAALGVKVPKMSGRGLGHTGGTVDKLESIPGYRTALAPDEFLEQVERVGVAVIGQTGELAPADKKLYSLRDVTATVGCIPLITSSIMSKKLAAGSRTIVLDVKCGSGAFMKTPEQAEELARSMVRIGRMCGRRTAALITDMDTPLGRNIGNSLEIAEAADVLKNGTCSDLREISEALASEMVSLVYGIPREEAAGKVKDAIDSGAAFAKMKEWISAQGGDASYLDEPSKFPRAKVVREVKSPCGGYISRMDSEKIGSAAVILGAGRTVKDAPVDHSAGIVLAAKTGERVKEGEPLCTLYANSSAAAENAEKVFLSAVSFAAEAPEKHPLIYRIVTG